MVGKYTYNNFRSILGFTEYMKYFSFIVYLRMFHGINILYEIIAEDPNLLLTLNTNTLICLKMSGKRRKIIQ